MTNFITFDPPVRPSPVTSTANEIKATKNEFGDGYTQIVTHGINNLHQAVTLKWDVLTKDDAAEINRFFKDLNGVPFYFELPEDGEPKTWRCLKWSSSWVSPFTLSISADLEKVYLP